MPAYTVTVRNPIVDQEVMKIDTDNRALAMSEAEYYSIRHGVASVRDASSGVEVARFRYGAAEPVADSADSTAAQAEAYATSSGPGIIDETSDAD